MTDKLETLQDAMQVTPLPGETLRYDPIRANAIPINELAETALGEFKSDDNGTWFMCDYLRYSDYVGTTVERANVRYFSDEYADHDDVKRVYSGYGGEGIIVNVNTTDETLIEELISLADYPLISEQDMFDIEQDILDEALSEGGYILEDYRIALQNRFYALDDTLTDMSAVTLAALLMRMFERANAYPEFETAVSVWIDVDALANETTEQDILDA